MARWGRSEIFVASVALFDKEGRLLFGKRQDTGKWVLPGGHLLIGESPLKGAVREVLEETSLRPTQVTYLGDGQVRRLEGNLRVYCFKAVVEGEPTGENDPDKECKEFRWVDVSNGLPPAEELPLRDRNNITLRLLKLQGGEIRKVEDEINAVFLSKAEWYDQPPILPDQKWHSSPAQVTEAWPPEGTVFPAVIEHERRQETPTQKEQRRVSYWIAAAMDWATNLRPRTDQPPPNFETRLYSTDLRSQGQNFNADLPWEEMNDKTKAVYWGLHYLMNPKARDDRTQELQEEVRVRDEAHAAAAEAGKYLSDQDMYDLGVMNQNYFDGPPPIVDADHLSYPVRWTDNSFIDRGAGRYGQTLTDETRARIWGRYLFYHSPERRQHQQALVDKYKAFDAAPPFEAGQDEDVVNWDRISPWEKMGAWRRFLQYAVGVDYNMDSTPPTSHHLQGEGGWKNLSESNRVAHWTGFIKKVLNHEMGETPPPYVSEKVKDEWASMSEDARKGVWDTWNALMFPSFTEEYLGASWRVPSLTNEEWNRLTPEQQEQEREAWNKATDEPGRHEGGGASGTYRRGYEARYRMTDPLISEYAQQEAKALAYHYGDRTEIVNAMSEPEAMEFSSMEEADDASLFLKTDKANRMHLQYALVAHPRKIPDWLQHPLIDKRHIDTIIPRLANGQLYRDSTKLIVESILAHKAFDHESMDYLVDALEVGSKNIWENGVWKKLVDDPRFTQDHATRLVGEGIKTGCLHSALQDSCMKKIPMQFMHGIVDSMTMLGAHPEVGYTRDSRDLFVSLGKVARRFLLAHQDPKEPGMNEFVEKLAGHLSAINADDLYEPPYIADLYKHPALSSKIIDKLLEVPQGSRLASLAMNPNMSQESLRAVLLHPETDHNVKELVLTGREDLDPATVKEMAAIGAKDPSVFWGCSLELFNHKAITAQDLEPMIQNFHLLDNAQQNHLVANNKLTSEQLHRVAGRLKAASDSDGNSYLFSSYLFSSFRDNEAVRPEHIDTLLAGAPERLEHILITADQHAEKPMTPGQVDRLLASPHPTVRTRALQLADHAQLLSALQRTPADPTFIPDNTNVYSLVYATNDEQGGGEVYSLPWNPEADKTSLRGMYVTRPRSDARGEDVARALLNRGTPMGKFLGLIHPDCPKETLDAEMRKIPLLPDPSNPAPPGDPTRLTLMPPRVTLDSWAHFSRLPGLTPAHHAVILNQFTTGLDPEDKKQRLDALMNDGVLTHWLARPDLPESTLRLIHGVLSKHKHYPLEKSFYQHPNLPRDIIREGLDQKPGESPWDAHQRWQMLLQRKDLSLDESRVLWNQPAMQAQLYPEQRKAIQEQSALYNAGNPMTGGVAVPPPNWMSTIADPARTLRWQRFAETGRFHDQTVPWSSHINDMDRLQKANMKVLSAAIGRLDPDTLFSDKVQVRFGMQKLRRIRDFIREKNPVKGELKPSQLPPGNWSAGRMPNGNISADKIDEHINTQTPEHFNISHSTWTGAQRHSDEPSQVLQVNFTTAMMQKLQQAGVYETFVKMAERSFASGHPALPQTLGWVRYTGNPGTGFHVDETQSDFGQSFVRQAAAQAAEAGEDVEEVTRRAEEEWPEDHYQKIRAILFGTRHPNEILNEAFHEFHRAKGNVETPVMIHSVESAAINRLGTELFEPCSTCMANAEKMPKDKRPEKKHVGAAEHETGLIGNPHPFKSGEKRLTAPVHYNKSYHEIPKDVMGMEAGHVYGELPTQTGKSHKGQTMWRGKIRKSEKDVWEDWLRDRGMEGPAFATTTDALASAAEHPDFPLIDAWIHHPEEDIRCAIARNPSLTPEQQGVMLKDPSKYVKRNVAINPSLHLSHQMAIATNPHSDIHDPSMVLKHWLSKNKNLHPEAAEALERE